MEKIIERVMRGQEEFMQDQRKINQQVDEKIKDFEYQN
jgi:hypothetical protein